LDLEIPERLATAVQGLVDAQSPLGLVLDNLNGETELCRATGLEQLVPAIREWLQRDLIDGWLYQRGKDGAMLAWVVHSVRHVSPPEGREPNTDPRMRFAGMTWGISFYAEDLPGRTLAGLFADHGFHKECAEFKQAYDQKVKRFMELQPQFGAQFLASGMVWRPGDGPRAAVERVVLPEGSSARCVNDEALLQRRFDIATDAHHWREHGVDSGFDRIPQHCYLHLFHLEGHRPIWAHVSAVQPYAYRPQLRERLVLPQAPRDLIDILIEDVMPGKSGGTTILCRGAPGLGKTLAAEVYAEVVGKPLYRVHSGQLGVTATSVEASLTKILQRAARWDCMLLLDDIDDAILSRCIAIIDYLPPSEADSRRLWALLAAQLHAELPPGLADELVAAYPGISGRDIKELLKLTTKFCRQRGLPLSAPNFAQCAVFRGLAAAPSSPSRS
jgi:hypothetical protein